MDKNLAALLRDDTYTVHVKFWKDRKDQSTRGYRILGVDSAVDMLSDKAYIYVTNIPDIKLGDHLIVLVMGVPKVVVVVKVDKDLSIQPNEIAQYKWVVTKLDYSYHDKITQENDAIVEVASKAYRKNTRKSFRNLFLSEMDKDTQVLLFNIMEDKK